jgi:hypothetical protein
MNIGEFDKEADAEFGENCSGARDQSHLGEVSPELIKWIAEDLKGAAYLCSALSLLGKDSTIEPCAIKAIGNLVRRAANALRDELAAAELRQLPAGSLSVEIVRRGREESSKLF